mgnify:CR=1 FL=1
MASSVDTFINRSLEKGGAFVTENLNAGKVSAEISAENEKISYQKNGEDI